MFLASDLDDPNQLEKAREINFRAQRLFEFLRVRKGQFVATAAGFFGGYLPIITSDDLITAETLSPTLSPRSSIASLVIEEKTVSPGANSTLTWAVVVPLVTAMTRPGRTLRALSFMRASSIVTSHSLAEPAAR